MSVNQRGVTVQCVYSVLFLCQARGEAAVREEFPDATILRPATCFGHEDHFLNYYACKLRIKLNIPFLYLSKVTTCLKVNLPSTGAAG